MTEAVIDQLEAMLDEAQAEHVADGSERKSRAKKSPDPDKPQRRTVSLEAASQQAAPGEGGE